MICSMFSVHQRFQLEMYHSIQMKLYFIWLRNFFFFSIVVQSFVNLIISVEMKSMCSMFDTIWSKAIFIHRIILIQKKIESKLNGTVSCIQMLNYIFSNDKHEHHQKCRTSAPTHSTLLLCQILIWNFEWKLPFVDNVCAEVDEVNIEPWCNGTHWFSYKNKKIAF